MAKPKPKIEKRFFDDGKKYLWQIADNNPGNWDVREIDGRELGAAKIYGRFPSRKQARDWLRDNRKFLCDE